jgi:hypothetical protein
MALLDDMMKGDLATGLTIGAGVLIVWPMIRPLARPIAKTLIKGGLIAYREAEQLYTGAVEGVSEVAQEAQQEIGATLLAQGHADGSAPRGI